MILNVILLTAVWTVNLMNDELYDLKHSISFFTYCIFLCCLFLEAGFINVDSSFFINISQDEVAVFVKPLIYLANFYVVLYLIVFLSFFIVFLVYRVSIRFIYSKPYRVYPVDESKENNLFSLR